MARQAPIWGLIGLFNAYLAHKQDLREQEHLDIQRSQIGTANELARKTFEQEYGTTAPDYTKPRIGGIADYARPGAGENLINYPEQAYEVKRTPGLQQYRAETARLNIGDKAYLNAPFTRELLDSKLSFLKDFDAKFGTNLMGALGPLATGVQSEIGKGTSLIGVANKFDKAVQANKENLMKRLELAGSHGEVQALMKALKNGTFSEMFFPIAIPHIRKQEADIAGKWSGTEEAAAYERGTKERVAGIGTKGAKEVADIRVKGAKEIAGIGAESREKVAEIGAEATIEASKIRAKALGKGKDKTKVTPADLIRNAKNRWDYVNKRQQLEQDAMGNIIVQDADEKRRPATKAEIEMMREEWGKEYDNVVGIIKPKANAQSQKSPSSIKEKAKENKAGTPMRKKGESIDEYLKRTGSTTF